MAILKSGYFNFQDNQSNEDNIKLTKVYIEQTNAIRKNLEAYGEGNLDKKAKRDLNTLKSLTLYIKDLGENLLGYLSTSDPNEGFELYSLQFDINNFIQYILAQLNEE